MTDYGLSFDCVTMTLSDMVAVAVAGVLVVVVVAIVVDMAHLHQWHWNRLHILRVNGASV